MPIWYNNDGLRIKSGQDEGLPGTGGQYSYQAENAVLTFDIDYTKLNAFGTATILSDTVRIPNGWRLESATFYVETAFTSGGLATLKFDLVDTDYTTSYGAMIAATAVASLTLGATITGAGALINTDLANNTPSIVTATVGTANFTAGKGRLILKLHKFD